MLVNNISVKQGDCKLDHAYLMYDNGSVAIIQIDSITKYPENGGIGDDYDTNIITVYIDILDTPNSNTSDITTEIKLELSINDPIIFVDCNRYTIFITVVKPGLDFIKEWDF